MKNSCDYSLVPRRDPQKLGEPSAKLKAVRVGTFAKSDPGPAGFEQQRQCDDKYRARQSRQNDHL
jgi:hypothetical protein